MKAWLLEFGPFEYRFNTNCPAYQLYNGTYTLPEQVKTCTTSHHINGVYNVCTNGCCRPCRNNPNYLCCTKNPLNVNEEECKAENSAWCNAEGVPHVDDNEPVTDNERISILPTHICPKAFISSNGDVQHSVTVVGFGVTETGKPYWKAINSHGSDWGDNGFMYIQYDEKDMMMGFFSS